MCDEIKQEWSQIKVTVKQENLSVLEAVMSMIDANIMTEDYSDIDLKTCYGDLIDESILNADKSIASVSVFVPAERNCGECVAFIKERLNSEKIDAEISISGVCESDWADSWKAYYKTLHIGNKTVIVPMWEEYYEKPDEIVVRMDPGMAFGTGTHETTRLVIGLLEDYVKEGCSLLDVGTGSGILAICAAKLGASECKAYDIDPVAVRVAKENIAANGVSDIVSCDVSDLLKQVEKGCYDIITANIVADIIIRMAPDIGEYMMPSTVLIASGIISERASEVIDAVVENGLSLVAKHEDNGWCALVISKNKEI